jgi:hypothetical protein
MDKKRAFCCGFRSPHDLLQVALVVIFLED